MEDILDSDKTWKSPSFLKYTNLRKLGLRQVYHRGRNKTKWSQVHVAVELDNITSVKYGRVAVSRSLRMSLKGAKNIFDKVEETKLALSFSHIAGEKNVDADE
jgi:hypothetical protein